MFRSSPHLVTQTIDSRSPLASLLSLAVVFGVILGGAARYAYGTAAPALAVFGTAVIFCSYGLAHGYPHPVLGACNGVTLARVAMVAFLVGALAVPDASAWLVFGVALVAFALDGVDGWLARRAGLVSDFGARFDMETDAGLGAVIAVWLLASGTAGPEILVLGFMRYAFVAASFFAPALRAPLPEAFRRKAICVVQIAALILLTFPLTPSIIALPLGIGAALLLSWSFLIDILWLTGRSG